MKSPAHPREYMGDGPVHISDAYSELSQEAFAIWIRLMAESPKTLLIGRKSLARLLGYSIRRCNDILLELVRKGYVQLQSPDQIGGLTKLQLRRKAIVNQRIGSWIKLG